MSRSANLRLVRNDEPAEKLAEELAFLPAALEVTETPPNPVGRYAALSLCAVTLAGLAWATFGQIDIVAVAGGKVVTPMRTQVVQPFETGSVAAILVKPGQQVHAGDPLIELDPTAAEAERVKARTDLAAARLDAVRLAAFLDGGDKAPFGAVADVTPADVARAEAQLTAQTAQRASQIAALRQEREQRVADRNVLERTVEKLERTLPLVSERAGIRNAAMRLGNASVLADLESKQLVVETKAELDISAFRIKSLEAAILGLDQKAIAFDAETRTAAMTDLSKAQDRIRNAKEALAKAARRVELMTLRAPADGTVQQMYATTIGAVVTPAQQLLSVVPDGEQVEIEAVLENRDIGFVTVGQGVELKVDAFPFTRYGLLRGTVTSLDRDAEAAPVNPAGQQGARRAADGTDQVEASERLRYTARIALEPGARLDVDGRPGRLVPGMSVKAEILTGKRRIIDYVLSPLREHLHDAMRER